MRNKKRPAYVTDMINRANAYFKAANVTDPYSSDLFNFLTQYLLEKNMYNGWNTYKTKSITVNNETVYQDVLSGGVGTEFIQMW